MAKIERLPHLRQVRFSPPVKGHHNFSGKTACDIRGKNLLEHLAQSTDTLLCTLINFLVCHSPPPDALRQVFQLEIFCTSTARSIFPQGLPFREARTLSERPC